ncbi:MAG: MBL fold metallo-hydrolase [Bacilli bacterium]|nr:MBL fold metallo-hydrolase [Bacilli bacterium]
MKIKVLASGSKGNSTYIETDQVKLLIDIGISFSYLTHELEKISINPSQLDGILITHTHSDHIKGLQSLVKRTNLPVYITEGMKKEISEKISESNIKSLFPETIIEDLKIECIPTSHDVESVGFLIEDLDTSLVYITDTGYINQKQLRRLVNKDIYIIESNHDEKMLMEGPYPYILKQRIISDKGHLSNHTVASYLVDLVGDKTKYIILAHLSEKNNTEQLAYQTTKELLEEHNIEKKILIAKPYESLETVEV